MTPRWSVTFVASDKEQWTVFYGRKRIGTNYTLEAALARIARHAVKTPG